MSEGAPTTEPTLAELASVITSQAQVIEELKQQNEAQRLRLAWFERQLFGPKSERFIHSDDSRQMHLGESVPLEDAPEPSAGAHEVAAQRRRPRSSTRAEAVPFFDETKVPVETIVVADPATEGLGPDTLEVVSEKISYKLAQRPGSYVILKYVRRVTKMHVTKVLECPPAPGGVLDDSRADVSFLAGLVVDKCLYHLPLYRQHQRLTAAGIRVTRPWLTQLMQQVAGLLEPLYEAQLASVRASRVLAMDETPIKAGLAGPGRMKGAYFWPVYGDADEVCFPFCESRRAEHVDQVLGGPRPPGSVLLTDGYGAYTAYAKKTGIAHAQCWAHCRRAFFDAKGIEPKAAEEALTQIAALYAVEEDIRSRSLEGPERRRHRLMHAKPLVNAFFNWIDKQMMRQAFLPSSPLAKALAYAHERRAGLEIFLTDPAVPLDTNHLERALRVIPMGRKAWLFSWTEAGAKDIGILQSLLVTCRLHDIDPYTYLVDVLQRIQDHPARQVEELTPRRWKSLFAANPKRSDCDPIRAQSTTPRS